MVEKMKTPKKKAPRRCPALKRAEELLTFTHTPETGWTGPELIGPQPLTPEVRLDLIATLTRLIFTAIEKGLFSERNGLNAIRAILE